MSAKGLPLAPQYPYILAEYTHPFPKEDTHGLIQMLHQDWGPPSLSNYPLTGVLLLLGARWATLRNTTSDVQWRKRNRITEKPKIKPANQNRTNTSHLGIAGWEVYRGQSCTAPTKSHQSQACLPLCSLHAAPGVLCPALLSGRLSADHCLTAPLCSVQTQCWPLSFTFLLRLVERMPSRLMYDFVVPFLLVQNQGSPSYSRVIILTWEWFHTLGTFGNVWKHFGLSQQGIRAIRI